MIHKIPITELKVGMYVHDVNCSWRIKPNFTVRYKITEDDQVEKIRELGTQEVYIDTNLGDDLPGSPTEDEARRKLEEEMQRLADRDEVPMQHRLANRKELADALTVHDSASRLVRTMMGDVRLGRQIEFDAVAESLQGITQTMLGNFGTMIQLGQLKTKDDYTFQHSVGVCSLLTAFCKIVKFNRRTTADVGIGALLHDIGKMRVPPQILNKPGRLTDGEFDEIRQHVAYGRDILAEAPWVSPTAFNVMDHHHERYDGTGYPIGLKGGEISHVGQMAAIVDVYDAITAERVYHQPMTPAEALRKLQEWSRFHFNEELVAHFICSLGIYPVRTVVSLESGLVGIVVEQNPADLIRPILLVVYDTRQVAALRPYRLDLAKSESDRILSYEAPEKYGIDVDLCLADS